jgi:predicted methyltransferase
MIAMAVADEQRPAADRERDPNRKPAEIVSFAGVEPGDKIAEIAPGGGYYTRILAKAVGPEGHVYALMPAFFANRPGGLDNINALAAQYPNVTVVVADFAALDLPEPVDLVWTTENYHDMANGDIAAINSSAFAVLKPGGLYFVEDHSAPGASCGGRLHAGGQFRPACQSRRSERRVSARSRRRRQDGEIRATVPQAGLGYRTIQP